MNFVSRLWRAGCLLYLLGAGAWAASVPMGRSTLRLPPQPAVFPVSPQWGNTLSGFLASRRQTLSSLPEDSIMRRLVETDFKDRSTHGQLEPLMPHILATAEQHAVFADQDEQFKWELVEFAATQAAQDWETYAEQLMALADPILKREEAASSYSNGDLFKLAKAMAELGKSRSLILQKGTMDRLESDRTDILAYQKERAEARMAPAKSTVERAGRAILPLFASDGFDRDTAHWPDSQFARLGREMRKLYERLASGEEPRGEKGNIKFLDARINAMGRIGRVGEIKFGRRRRFRVFFRILPRNQIALLAFEHRNDVEWHDYAQIARIAQNAG